jgi:biotin transport system substrate-specific component
LQVKEMLLCALMVAVMAVLAQLTIPVGAVPFTMSIMGVYLAAGILGKKLAPLAMIVYVLLGAFGAPIFTGAKGGLPVVAGPTGGFLWGYIVAAYLIAGLYPSKQEGISYFKVGGAFLAGMLVIYGLGLIQLSFLLGMDLKKAFLVGAAPFLVPDMIKIAVAVLLVVPIRGALDKAGLLP